MEDSSRDLEKELKKYAVSNPFKRTGQWQMLLISDDGKMVSVKRYKDLAVFVIALMVVFMVATAVFSVLYFRTFSATRDLASKIKASEQERKELQEERDRLVAQLFMSKKTKDVVGAEPKSESKAEPKKDPKKEEAVQATNPPPVKKVVKKAEKMKAAVKDLTVTKDEAARETRIRFIVKNDCELPSIAGRVFLILKPDTDNDQEWLTMPPVTLKDGAPSMPSRGQFFSINNYKSVNFKFSNPMPDDHYKTMAIYIFSTEGDLIFEDTFPIDLIVVNKFQAQPDPSDEETDTAPGSSEKPATNPVPSADVTRNLSMPAFGASDDEGGNADEE